MGGDSAESPWSGGLFDGLICCSNRKQREKVLLQPEVPGKGAIHAV